jgi:hypothetical protein
LTHVKTFFQFFVRETEGHTRIVIEEIVFDGAVRFREMKTGTVGTRIKAISSTRLRNAFAAARHFSWRVLVDSITDDWIRHSGMMSMRIRNGIDLI